jgi:hypothetical protein
MILAIDPGLSGAAAVLDKNRELIEVYDLPVIGDGARRRIDAANLADMIRAHAPYTLCIVEFARKRDHNRAEAALLGLYWLKAVDK